MLRVIHMLPPNLSTTLLDRAVPEIWPETWTVPEIRIDPADARHMIGLTGRPEVPALVSFDSGDTWVGGTARDAAWPSAWGPVAGLSPAARTEIGRRAGISALGGDLAAAADPRDPANLYLAWVEPSVEPQVGTWGDTNSRLRLRRSHDGGSTWSPDLRIVPRARGAALAVNDRGEVVLLYRQLTGRLPDQRWVVYLEHSTNGFVTMAQWVLADMPIPTTEVTDPLGNMATEQRVDAFKEVFYGAFVADRRSSLTQFPSGVRFPPHGNIDGSNAPEPARTGSTPVSHDPFFFRFSAAV